MATKKNLPFFMDFSSICLLFSVEYLVEFKIDLEVAAANEKSNVSVKKIN
jgi:hypothetical protein